MSSTKLQKTSVKSLIILGTYSLELKSICRNQNLPLRVRIEYKNSGRLNSTQVDSTRLSRKITEMTTISMGWPAKDSDITVDLLELAKKRRKVKAVVPWLEMRGERIEWANYVALNVFDKPPKHGAAYHWIGRSYRNINLLFWDAEGWTFVYPYTGIDDYGSVPTRFRVGNKANEFLPDHWVNDVDHNCIVFLSDELVDEVRARMRSMQERYISILIKDRSFDVEINHDGPIRSDFNCLDSLLIQY